MKKAESWDSGLFLVYIGMFILEVKRDCNNNPICRSWTNELMDSHPISSCALIPACGGKRKQWFVSDDNVSCDCKP